jgi:hypothetical protein
MTTAKRWRQRTRGSLDPAKLKADRRGGAVAWRREEEWRGDAVAWRCEAEWKGGAVVGTGSRGHRG